VHIYKGKSKYITFITKMDDAHNLIDGQQLTYLFSIRKNREGEESEQPFYHIYNQAQKAKIEEQSPKVCIQI